MLLGISVWFSFSHLSGVVSDDQYMNVCVVDELICYYFVLFCFPGTIESGI